MGGIPRESLDRLVYFRREMEKILREFFEATGEEFAGEASSNILADVLETPDEIIIQAELPGFAKGDVSVEVMRNSVIITGHKRERAQRGKVSFIALERAYGTFRRVLDLPVAGDTRQISAAYAQGILTITIPKIKERRGQKRKVDVACAEEA
jgi:HSP20 family protein